MSDLIINPYDLEREVKRARSILKTHEGRAALRTAYAELPEWQRNDYAAEFAQPEEEEKDTRPLVVMLIPTHYCPQPHMFDSFQRVTAYSKTRVRVHGEPAMSTSIISWARNQLLATVYQKKIEFDYVMFWDDDISVEENALDRLLAHKVDIVGGACTLRKDPPLPNFRTWEPDTYTFRTAFQWSGEGLIESGGVGTGFMLISKKALDATAEYYLSCTHEQKYLGMSSEKAAQMSAWRRAYAEKHHNSWWFELLKHPLGEGEYGEDLAFCFKARECGFKVFVDTSLQPLHWGMHGFGMKDYMPYQQAQLEREAAKEAEKNSGVKLITAEPETEAEKAFAEAVGS